MPKTIHDKKKKSGKTVYTYKEYVEKLRPKSLGRIEDTYNEPAGSYDKLTLQKDCGLRHHFPADHK